MPVNHATFYLSRVRLSGFGRGRVLVSPQPGDISAVWVHEHQSRRLYEAFKSSISQRLNVLKELSA
jgi:hypothetical protein